MYADPTIIAAEQVNLSGSWSSFIGLIDGSLLTLAMYAGFAIIVAGVVMLVWSKRRGGGKTTAYIAMIIAGAILAAPKALIPLFLLIIDAVLNIVNNTLTKAF